METLLRFIGLTATAALLVSPFAATGQTIGWPAYGGADGGGHYTAAGQITPQNVERLELAWTHRSGDFREGVISGVEGFDAEGQPASGFINTPIVVEDTLYYCTPFNRVFALDPRTGEERWRFDPKVNMALEHLTNCRAVSSWIDPQAPPGALCAHRIILATLDGRIVALDGAGGKRCSGFGDDGEIDLTVGLTEHEASEYAITSAPAIIGDKLVTGAYVLDSFRPDVPAGVVRAYDLRSGAFVWGWNPVPPGKPAVDAEGNFIAGTTNVWSTISVDAERNLVFLPTGNSSPDYYGGDRGGDLDYYSSSVVALDASTGEVVWRYQTVHHDVWDLDVPAQPTLVDLTIDGVTSPAVVQVTKMGMTFVLHRETGQPLHPVEERPVPQTGAVAGEYLSPTQPFPVKPEPLHQLGISPEDAWGFTFWDRGQCRKALEELTTGPIYTPLSEKGTVMYPSNLGGQNWGSPAVDPGRGLMVTDTKHVGMVVRLVPRADQDEDEDEDEDEECGEDVSMPQQGSPYCVLMRPFLSPWGAPCTKPPWSTLAAVDLSTGDIVWQVPLGNLKHLAPWPISLMGGTMEMGGPMVTGSGLTFIAATADRRLRAFSTETGDELWSDELPTTGNAVPMSYVSGGKQFVVIAAGGHFTSPSPPGDHLMAYSLP